MMIDSGAGLDLSGLAPAERVSSLRADCAGSDKLRAVSSASAPRPLDCASGRRILRLERTTDPPASTWSCGSSSGPAARALARGKTCPGRSLGQNKAQTSFEGSQEARARDMLWSCAAFSIGRSRFLMSLKHRVPLGSFLLLPYRSSLTMRSMTSVRRSVKGG